MNNNLSRFSLKIPTVIRADSDYKDDLDNLYHIILTVSSFENNNQYTCKKYLELDEAKQIISWLADSISYTENLQKTDAQIIIHSGKPWLKVLDCDQLKEGRLQLVGQFTIETKNNEEPYIIIDVVTEVNQVWVRLITFDEIILSCWFCLKTAKDLINGFSRAILHLSQNPPQIISNLHIGKVEAFSDDGQICAINIEIEEAGSNNGNTQRIMIELIPLQDEDSYLDIWWLDDTEVSKLWEFIVESLIVWREKRLVGATELVIGSLAEPEGPPWLIVALKEIPTVLVRDDYPNSTWVNLTFDDELVRENNRISKFWLTPDSAQQLSQLLSTAIKNQETFVPTIDSPSHSDDLVIFELTC